MFEIAVVVSNFDFCVLFWFGLILCHVGTVSLPNHTYSWASLTKRLTWVFRAHKFASNRQQSFLNQRKGGEWPKTLFHDQSRQSMGPGRDLTRDPLICSQTRIFSQVQSRLSYAAQNGFRGKLYEIERSSICSLEEGVHVNARNQFISPDFISKILSSFISWYPYNGSYTVWHCPAF